MLKFHNPLLDEEGTRQKALTIAKAIVTRSVLSLNYNNGEKKQIEPFVLGIHKDTGKYILQCLESLPFDFTDKEENWLLLELDSIQNLQTTTIQVSTYRKNYFPLASVMEEVVASIADSQKIV